MPVSQNKFYITYFDEKAKYGIATIKATIVTPRVRYHFRQYVRTQMKRYLEKNYKRQRTILSVQFFRLKKLPRVLAVFYFIPNRVDLK